MDKVFSTRMDAQLVTEIDRITKKLGIAKKRFIEEAVRMRLAREDSKNDIWEETSGAWKGNEDAGTRHSEIRDQFERAFQRHRDPS